jgi:hypothetical protein
VKSFAEAVLETAGFIDRAVARIEAGQGVATEAHNVRTYLISLLEIVERDPGLDAAADDLHAACTAFAEAAEKAGPDQRQRRLLREAVIRFKDRLPAARPNEAARRLGLQP